MKTISVVGGLGQHTKGVGKSPQLRRWGGAGQREPAARSQNSGRGQLARDRVVQCNLAVQTEASAE